MTRLDAAVAPSPTPELEPPATLRSAHDECPADEWPDDLLSAPPPNLESDEPPLESDLHREQIDLLIRLLKYWWRDRTDFYIAGNLTVYYSVEETKKRDFRGPDIFIVMGAEPRPRKSWTIWYEGGQYPNVVIELLSDSTAAVDRGTKKELYQNTWRLPEYYWFHPDTHELAGFRLVQGIYEAITPDANGHLLSQELGLKLGLYQQTLRWFTIEGELIPIPEEVERQAKEQAQKNQRLAEKQAHQEQQARKRLEDYLRSQGIDPNNLPPLS